MKSQGLFHLEFCFSCRLRPLSMPLHLWLHHCASDYSTLRLLLCERLHISSSASVSYATPNFFCFSFCRRQSWLILLDLLWGILTRFLSLRFVIEILIIIFIYFSLLCFHVCSDYFWLSIVCLMICSILIDFSDILIEWSRCGFWFQGSYRQI